MPKRAVLVARGRTGDDDIYTYVEESPKESWKPKTLSQASYVPARAFWKKKPVRASVASLRSSLPEPTQPRAGGTVKEWLEQHKRRPLHRMTDGRWFSTSPKPMGLFRKLPEPVRQKIWTYAVTYRSAFNINAYRGDGRLNYCRSLVTRRVPNDSLGFPVHEDNVRALQLVCRQIQQETNLLFYKQNWFNFVHDTRHPGNDVEALVSRFKQQIGDEAFSQIKALYFISHSVSYVTPWKPALQQPLIDKIAEDLKAIASTAQAHSHSSQALRAQIAVSLDFAGELNLPITQTDYQDPNYPMAGVIRAVAGGNDSGQPWYTQNSRMMKAAAMRDGRQKIALAFWFDLKNSLEGLEKGAEVWEKRAEREKTNLGVGDAGKLTNWEYQHAALLARQRSYAVTEGVRCLREVKEGVVGVLP